MGAPAPDLDEGAEQHPEARSGATGGSHVDRLPRRIQTEEPVKALVRPPPVVVWGGMVDLYPVRRGKNAPTGSSDAVELGHGPARVFTVLEHLRAEDDVEPVAVERYVLDGSDDIGCRSGNNVEADVLVCNAREEGKVRLDATADVQDPDTRTGRPQLLGLRLKPVRECRTNEPRGRRWRGVPPLFPRPPLAGRRGTATEGGLSTADASVSLFGRHVLARSAPSRARSPRDRARMRSRRGGCLPVIAPAPSPARR